MATIAIPVATPRRGTRQEHISGRSYVPEVCFSKFIDNSRLRREVDPDRKRECYSLLFTAILLFTVILGIAWQHFDCVRGNYQIEELKRESLSLRDLNKQLRLEKAAMTDPQRIDALARQDLGLIPPAPQQVIQVEGALPDPAQAGDPEFARNNDVSSPASSIVTREQ